VADQLLEPLGQQMPGDAERRLEGLEAAGAQEAFAQDQQRPTVADHADRARHRARFVFELIPSHGRLRPVARIGGCAMAPATLHSK